VTNPRTGFFFVGVPSQ